MITVYTLKILKTTWINRCLGFFLFTRNENSCTLFWHGDTWITLGIASCFFAQRWISTHTQLNFIECLPLAPTLSLFLSRTWNIHLNISLGLICVATKRSSTHLHETFKLKSWKVNGCGFNETLWPDQLSLQRSVPVSLNPQSIVLPAIVLCRPLLNNIDIHLDSPYYPCIYPWFFILCDFIKSLYFSAVWYFYNGIA